MSKSVIAFFKRYWITLLIFAGMALFYWAMSASGTSDAVLFPKVQEIGAALKVYLKDIPINVASSFRLLIPSFLISAALAIAIGVPMGLNQRVRDALYPVIYAISVVPAILLSPFALHLAPDFGSASLFMIVYATIWATLFSTINGVMTIDKRFLDNAATLKLTGFNKLVHVILPAAMPSIMSGLVTSLRGSFLMLVFVEMYGTNHGLGFFVKKSADLGFYDDTWAGFIVMVIVLVAVMLLFEKFKNYILRWTI